VSRNDIFCREYILLNILVFIIIEFSYILKCALLWDWYYEGSCLHLDRTEFHDMVIQIIHWMDPVDREQAEIGSMEETWVPWN
jgi:hypothetical protein